MIIKDDTKVYFSLRKGPTETEQWCEIRTTDNGIRDEIISTSFAFRSTVQISVAMFTGREIVDRAVILNRKLLQGYPSLEEILTSGRPQTIIGERI